MSARSAIGRLVYALAAAALALMVGPHHQRDFYSYHVEESVDNYADDRSNENKKNERIDDSDVTH